MSFLKRLFFGGGRDIRNPDTRYITLYIRPKACKEVLLVRVDKMNELSRTDDDKGFFVRKMARGNRCPFPVEIELTLDGYYNITEQVIVNGEAVSEADYEAFTAS